MVRPTVSRYEWKKLTTPYLAGGPDSVFVAFECYLYIYIHIYRVPKLI